MQRRKILSVYVVHKIMCVNNCQKNIYLILLDVPDGPEPIRFSKLAPVGSKNEYSRKTSPPCDKSWLVCSFEDSLK